MKVMVMVKATASSEAGALPSEQLLTEMGAFNEELVKAGVMLAGEGLKPTSAGVRVRFSGKDRTVIDGPFAETKELLAGFWLWRVESMDEAIAWVKRCPNPHHEESEIEIRPIFSAEDFGEAMTPELLEQEASVRAQSLGLGEIHYADMAERRIIGIQERYNQATRANIPAQWMKFAPRMGEISGRVGGDSYGVCWNTNADCEFDYLTGVETADSANDPNGPDEVLLPAGRYAVFTHDAPISKIAETIDGIWSKWAPDCELKLATGAPCFERYTERFDPSTGLGAVEIWVPLAS